MATLDDSSWDYEAIVEATARTRQGEATLSSSVTTKALITFELGLLAFAIDIRYARKVDQYHTITPLPKAPFFVLGVFYQRAELITIIDLCALLALPSPLALPRGMLLLRDGDRQFGVPTRGLPETLQVKPEEIADCPEDHDQRALLEGQVSGRMLLDAPALFEHLARCCHER
jgi:purine-binding chemotaxis protein CheW